MHKPVIAVTPLYNTQTESTWMLPGYVDGVIQAGGIPVILPLLTDETDIRYLAHLYDGFLFTGGQDVNPTLYGEETLTYCEETCPRRDRLEQILLDEALRLDKAVLGICRGIQIINSALGGTLFQDIDRQAQRDILIQHSQKSKGDIPVHSVNVKPDNLLSRVVGAGQLMVNSLHHQAIKDLAPQLEVCALSPDGLVEAVTMPDKHFVLAVQWHPELMWPKNEAAFALFKEFVKAAGSR
ncbi:MAG TPA: gamma-glutamyl-gamma-aminobutyrate hydrolase family protein [Negativicutes bacterium]|nr:gamma-glutamyl-gamma-aminobutyrate hydrolase family protein [Negativicutes bacterium]